MVVTVEAEDASMRVPDADVSVSAVCVVYLKGLGNHYECFRSHPPRHALC